MGTVVVRDIYVDIRLIPSSYDASCSTLSHIYLERGIDKKNEQGAMDPTLVVQKGHTETGCKSKETARSGDNRRQEAIALPCV